MPFENIIASVRRFFRIDDILQRHNLKDEAEKNGKCAYVEASKAEDLQAACEKLDNIKKSQAKVAKDITQIKEKLNTLSTEIINEAEKQGVLQATSKNFAWFQTLSDKAFKVGAIIAALGAAAAVLPVALQSLIETYEKTKDEEEFNERFYEKLLNEEYEERKYIIGLLEDARKEQEIRQTQSVIDLPVVQLYRTAPLPPPMMSPPPPPRIPSPPSPVDKEPLPSPEVENPEPEPEEVSVSEEILVPTFEEEPESKVTEAPVIESVSPVESSSSTPDNNGLIESGPPPVASVYGDPPSMQFSRNVNFALFKSSLTDAALKALGLEKASALLGTTVVSAVLVHYTEQALNKIHDLVVERLGDKADE